MRKLKLSSQVSKSWKLIGWQVSRETTTNKMADRCGESNNVLIQSLSIVSRENALKKHPIKEKQLAKGVASKNRYESMKP